MPFDDLPVGQSAEKMRESFDMQISPPKRESNVHVIEAPDGSGIRESVTSLPHQEPPKYDFEEMIKQALGGDGNAPVENPPEVEQEVEDQKDEKDEKDVKKQKKFLKRKEKYDPRKAAKKTKKKKKQTKNYKSAFP